MADLRPYPFGALAAHMLRELREADSIFTLPARNFYLGDPERDLSVRFHERRASTGLGPAAGPHTQMAQNIVLAWLTGCRIFELKTVQVDDRLEIPRPCIDMQTIGYNIEWSQELRLEESLEEYVKAAMLIELLRASGELELAPGFGDSIFDMSLGYDLAGIRSESVTAFVAGMRDCSEHLRRLRGELPASLGQLRDLDYPTQVSDTLTLSTFHGCPPDEIERIAEYVLEEQHLNCVVKLNPLLLGSERLHELLHGKLGYDDVRVPADAFERDAKWEQVLGFTERLARRAEDLGLGFGLKLTNTLIVENHREFFPEGAKEMYLSGQPLHVLAMELVRDLRREFGQRVGLSFSAGIDRKNYPDAVALGLVPVTTCTDLLRPGGYARASKYHAELARRMAEVGARNLDEWVQRAYGAASKRPPDAVLANTESYVDGLAADPRYARARNSKPPKKIGSELKLLDCITCDKCLPTCPNVANFTFVLAVGELPVVLVRSEGDRFVTREAGVLEIAEKHQIGNFADFCNECGNCDVFCPEDGGPQLVKPRFFGTLADWEGQPTLDGLWCAGPEEPLRARVSGQEYTIATAGNAATYAGPGFDLSFALDRRESTLSGHAETEADLGLFELLLRIRAAVYGRGSVNIVSARSRR